MPLGVADTSNALAEGEHGRLGHRTRTGRDGLLNGRNNVTDVDTQVRRDRRQPGLALNSMMTLSPISTST